MRRIDEFLTRKAQVVFPTAVVYRETATGNFFLELAEGDRRELRGRFQDARRALYQLIKAEKARRGAAEGGDR